MKTFLRASAINGFSLFVLDQAVSGVAVSGGLRVFILGGVFLTILGITLKPIFNLISIPLNAVTLGLFSFLTNALLLYILTILVTEIKIDAFTFEGFSWAGFIIPEFHLNTLFAYIVCATLLSLIQAVINWLIER
ncbi:MAG: phage holin family protein [Patescibacteria group bacterium]